MVEDDKGYIRGKPEHSDLISRQLAFDKIYKLNREEYPLKFKEYDVHHRDRKKHNNDIDNLDIVTREEHKDIHLLGLKGRKELYAHRRSKKPQKSVRSRKLKEKRKKDDKINNIIWMVGLIIIGIILIVNYTNPVIIPPEIKEEPFSVRVEGYTIVIDNNQDKKISFTIKYHLVSEWFGLNREKINNFDINPNSRYVLETDFTTTYGCGTIGDCEIKIDDYYEN